MKDLKEWAVSVKIGNQSFYVYSAGDKKSDALWMAKMLRIALKKTNYKTMEEIKEIIFLSPSSCYKCFDEPKYVSWDGEKTDPMIFLCERHKTIFSIKMPHEIKL